jgi:hypothetical protein
MDISDCTAVFWIGIQINKFLGLPDPDLLVRLRGTDSDPVIIKQK